MTSPTDPRAVSEFRVPAAQLKVGDLVNTAPGEGDWQQVTGVFTGTGADPDQAELKGLVDSLGGRYVVVTLTDLLPVDGGIYFSAGTALVAGDDESEDQSVADAVSSDDGERVYLYTKFELVTIRL